MSPESERLRNLFLFCITSQARLLLPDDTGGTGTNHTQRGNSSYYTVLDTANTSYLPLIGTSPNTGIEPMLHSTGADPTEPPATLGTPDAIIGSIINTTQQVILPIICAFGVVGNFLTMLLFSKRVWADKCTSVEKGCLITLSSLSLSDLCFCLVTTAGSMVRTQGLIFTSKDFGYAYQMYGGYFQNVFIKASTWLTMIAGISRYAIVCYPIWARNFIRLFYIKLSVIMTFVLAFSIHTPLLWTHQAHNLPCGNITLLILDTGYFLQSQNLHYAFTYLWAIIGYFLPVITLAYCNARLIVAYRKSLHFRLQHGGGGLRPGSIRTTNVTSPTLSTSATSSPQLTSVLHDRITVTLIIIILFFIVLMSPSEILHFCHEATMVINPEVFSVAVVITNVLQAVNFSANFVLYSMMNVYVRKNFATGIYKCCSCLPVIKRKATIWHSARHSSLRPMLSKATVQSAV